MGARAGQQLYNLAARDTIAPLPRHQLLFPLTGQTLMTTHQRMLLVVDSELAPKGITADLLATVLATHISTTTSSGRMELPILLLAHGSAQARVVDIDPNDGALRRWAAELQGLLATHASAALHPVPEPSASALLSNDGVLARTRSLTFATSSRSRSCTAAALRPVLEVLETRHQHLELLLLADSEQPPAVPPELYGLQGEFALSAIPIPDRLAVRAWLASSLAKQQAVEVSIDLQPEATIGQGPGEGQMRHLRCALMPALLHEHAAVDAHACVCHGEPLDAHGFRKPTACPADRGGQHEGGTMSALRCPVSALQLDRSDVRAAGFIGRFSWDGSLAPFASEDGAAGLVSLHADDATRTRRQPSMKLIASRRIPLAEVSLPTLYGSPWRLVPFSVAPILSASRTAATPIGMPTDDDDPAEAALLRGLAQAMHARSEALLCRCSHRDGFGAHITSPSNAQALLAANLLLLPTGPPHHSLLAKAMGSPAQLVPLPCILKNDPEADRLLDVDMDAEGTRERERAAAGLASATAALAALPADFESFNPLVDCAHGSSEIIVQCLATPAGPVTRGVLSAGALATNPIPAPHVRVAPSVPGGRTDNPSRQMPASVARPGSSGLFCGNGVAATAVHQVSHGATHHSHGPPARPTHAAQHHGTCFPGPMQPPLSVPIDGATMHWNGGSAQQWPQGGGTAPATFTGTTSTGTGTGAGTGAGQPVGPLAAAQRQHYAQDAWQATSHSPFAASTGGHATVLAKRTGRRKMQRIVTMGGGTVADAEEGI